MYSTVVLGLLILEIATSGIAARHVTDLQTFPSDVTNRDIVLFKLYEV